MVITFNTDAEKLNFLLEADANLRLGLLAAEGKLELVTEELPAEERPKYITNFIGSKQKLVDWIWSNTPEDAKSVFDAFSGSSVVGYMYKTKGLQVFSNDRLSYCYHAARAIVENNNTRLSEKEIESLLKDHNSDAGTFIQKNFHGIFFKNDVLTLLDVLRANIDALSGTKKSMALFALGKTCMSGGGFGHFSSTTKGGQRNYTVQSFIDHYQDNLLRINALVFDNGKENKAFNGDITDIAPKVKADLVYFDPPYATQFSSTNYEKYYHFVEGLMDYWKNKEIDHAKKIRNYKIDDPGVTPHTAKQFFTNFLTASKHIPHWLISYRDNAYPTESEIKGIVADLGKDSRMKLRDHKYQLAGKNRQGEPSNAKERLFVCAEEIGPDEFDLSATANMEEIADLILDTDFDPDVMSAIAGKTDNVLVTGYIGNKHFVMNWIDKNFPKDAKSLFDAFSGGANVAYFYKRKGLRVVCNDIMRYPYHIARAVIENNTETISDEELEGLLKKNPDAGTFIADTFYGYYYTKPILQFMDNVWANIQELKGYKKDIALAALGHTCKAKAVFGMFNRSKMNRTRKISDLAEGYRSSSIGNIPISEFVTAFKKYIRQINGLVYDNGQENKAHNGDVLKILPEVKADVIYCDPPYITEFLRNDYEDYYHFVEGLMTCWKGKEILNTRRRNFESRTKYDRDSIRDLLEKTVAAASKKFPHILISYRDKAYPTQKELGDMVAASYGDVTVRKIAVEYNIVKRESAAGGKYANELLFIAKKRKAGAAHGELNEQDLIETMADDFRMKTRKNSQLTLGHSILHRWYAAGWDSEGKNSATTWTRYQVVMEHTRLHSVALERGHVFSFMPGTIDETLPEAVKNQVKQKLEENKASASVHTEGANHASIIGEISIVREDALSTESMSLDDTEMEGDKKFTFILTHAGTNKNDDHFTVEELGRRHQTAVNKKIDLKHSQDFTDIVGGIVASDFVQQTDRAWVECAGELYTNENTNARLAYKLMKKGIITQVSMECDYEEGECSICGKRVKSKADYCIHLKKFKGGEFKGKPVYEILHGITFTGLGLLDRKGADENAKIKQVASSENTSCKGGSNRMEDETKNTENTENEAANDKLAAKVEELEKRIKELETENRDLKSKLDDTTKKYEKVKAEQEATTRRTRAEKFVKSLEERGLTFEDESDREAELERLAGLSDDAFKASEDAYSRVDFNKNPSQDGSDQNQSAASRNRGGSMRSSADIRPRDVDDNKKSLEDKLKSGFMAAYQDRVGTSSQ